MIIDDENIELWKKAGKLTARTISHFMTRIKPGDEWKSLCQSIEQYIIDQGAIPAFPPQISINQFAAHQFPGIDDSYIIKENDILKLDVGVCYQGAIGDSAVTIVFNKELEPLAIASKQALLNAISTIARGERSIALISKEIEDTITSFGYKPILNLTGHSLAYYNVHDEPSIPNFYDKNNTQELAHNQVIAIEPFATNGSGKVKEKGSPNIFRITKKKPIRNPIISRVVNYIEKRYRTLPFSLLSLTKEFSIGTIKLALRHMDELDMLESYPPLYEISSGLVSQHEHTLIIRDEKPIITTQRDDD